MNEFTKEELQLIQWEINTAVNKLHMGTLSSEKHSELNEKIKYMIDNYCEHEWNFNELMTKIVLNPGEAFPVECKKCGLPYNL